MDIYINGRFLTQPITGVQRFATELIKSLDELLENQQAFLRETKCFLITPRSTLHAIKLKNINLLSVGRFKGHLWEQLELPYYTRGHLLLNLCNTGPLFKNEQIATIHDTGVFATPDSYSFLFRSWYKLVFNSLGKRAKKIITVSNFSKSELYRYCKITPNKVDVIQEGCEHLTALKSKDSILTRLKISPKKFILAVSSMNPNKNFFGILSAIPFIEKNNIDIVIAGSNNPKIFNRSHLPQNSKTIYSDYISDQELKTLYENALCFIYPSFYEGFGLPPLEAMSLGCPVIAAQAASLPEVCGDAALYCDPYSPEDIAKKITILLDKSSLREELAEKGMKRAKQFRWNQVATAVLETIQTTLKNL